MTDSKLESESPFKRRGLLVTLGDSLTEFGFSCDHGGWVGRLSEWYSRKVDVINRGYSGYNTIQALELVNSRADTIFPTMIKDSMMLSIVFYGANDAALPSVAPWQHVPVDLYAANLENIILVLQKQGSAVLVLAPPPVDHDMWDERCKMESKTVGSRHNNVTKLYAEAAVKVAQKLGLPYVDCWSEFQRADSKWGSKYLVDGLHFNKEGNDLLFRLVRDTIKKDLSEFAPEQRILDAPVWREFDPEDLKGSWMKAATQYM